MKVGRLLLVAGALTVACARPRAESPSPADIAWQRTLDSAQHLAAAAQYGSADSLLALFARNEPGSSGAREAIFWHGVFLLEPANTSARLHDAVAAFSGYLSQGGALPHRTEALVLKRATLVMDSLSQLRSMDSVPAMHLVVSDDSSKSTAREQDMAKAVKLLQDSLNKTTAELERIKKRLSTTPPGKP